MYRLSLDYISPYIYSPIVSLFEPTIGLKSDSLLCRWIVSWTTRFRGAMLSIIYVIGFENGKLLSVKYIVLCFTITNYFEGIARRAAVVSTPASDFLSKSSTITCGPSFQSVIKASQGPFP